MEQKMNLVFNTKTPKGVHEAVGAYYSAIMGMMKDLVTPRVSYDASVVILTGPRGYDLSTMYEPYSKTPDILVWFSGMVHKAKTVLAASANGDGNSEAFEEDMRYLETAHKNLKNILEWCIRFLDPRTVYESVCRLEPAVAASFIDSADWVELYKQLDTMFPQYISQGNISQLTKFPDISTIFNEEFSSKMRTDLILYAVGAGKSMFDSAIEEPISEVSKWLVRSLKLSDEEAVSDGFTPYILSKVSVSKLTGYLYRTLLSFGDVDETLARYRDSLTDESPETLVAQIETYCHSVISHKKAVATAIRALIGPVSFSSISADTLVFILSVRPPKNYAAYDVYLEVLSTFLDVFQHTKPSDNFEEVAAAAKALAGLMNFNAIGSLEKVIGDKYDVQSLAGLRISATRYFDGIVSQQLAAIGTIDEIVSCKTFGDIIVLLDSKLGAANAVVSDIRSEINDIDPIESQKSGEDVRLAIAEEKVKAIMKIRDSVGNSHTSISQSYHLRGYDFAI